MENFNDVFNFFNFISKVFGFRTDINISSDFGEKFTETWCAFEFGNSDFNFKNTPVVGKVSCDFGICHVTMSDTYYISNDTNWFQISNKCINVFTSTIQEIEQDLYYEISLSNCQTAKFSDIHIPVDILNAYYASFCVIPTQILGGINTVLFTDEKMENPPIMLPKWTVLKYCKPSFSNVDHVLVSIVTDQEVANAIMNAFENQTKPVGLTKIQLSMYLEMFTFLIQ